LLRQSLAVNVVIDGELVMWDPDRGRTSFAQMQRRLTAGRGLPELVRQYLATLVAFDLLQDADGGSLLSEPLVDRRAHLTGLLAEGPNQLSLCPQTTSRQEANQWLTAWTALGVEGLVGKDPAGKYTPGKRGWLKASASSPRPWRSLVGSPVRSATRRRCCLAGTIPPAGFAPWGAPIRTPSSRDERWRRY
jgi:ATP-dependent DNA ligase